MSNSIESLTTALSDRYRIERELGAGGMATVYLAHDVRHDRKVALKVLRPELSAILGAERFLHEIKTTANLQHPHILSLFDSGEAGGFVFYVMPYVEGESLRDRLMREKQLPVEDAVRIAREVADALEYAHPHGVVHRDIKPENILLHGGHAMVADFGIALAASRSDGGSRMTETGMSLGTPHYMSPEQAMGEREITPRSDIYALGCVLYEMLTAEPPFVGATAQAIIARVLTEEPRSLTLQRKSIPPHVEAVVMHALEKLPADRFATAAEFGKALGDAGYHGTGFGPHGTVALRTGRGSEVTGRLQYVALGAAVLFAALAAWAWLRPAPSPIQVPVIRYVLAATPSTRPNNRFPWPAAISPDGSTIVYSVAESGGSTRLYALRTDQTEARPIPGTTDGFQPFFSPDGSWLAFGGAGGKEYKVRLDGSAPVAVADHGGANGADWTDGNEFVIGAVGPFHGLSRVNAGGGKVAALTQPDTAKDEAEHVWPIGLPGGKLAAFVIWKGNLTTSELALVSLADGKVTPLGVHGIRPLALLDGMLVYAQADGAIMAVKLDLGHRRTDGLPIPVLDPVPVESGNNGNSGVFVSRGGALVTSGGELRSSLTWLTRQGRPEELLPLTSSFEAPRLSPDERRVAVVVLSGHQTDVWIYDRQLTTFSRLTSSGTVTSAEWSADGRYIIFTASGEGARTAVWRQVATGGAPPTELFHTAYLAPSATLSPDGRWLLVTALRENSWDILRAPLDSPGVAQEYVATPAVTDAGPRFSPDGKWVSLISTESGRSEIFVRSFPDPSAKFQVSVNGGTEPTWAPDGRALYYSSGGVLMRARVRLTPTFTLIGRDTILADPQRVPTTFFAANYDVARDGKRVLEVNSTSSTFQLVISPNWITEFRRRVAESRGGVQ